MREDGAVVKDVALVRVFRHQDGESLEPMHGAVVSRQEIGTRERGLIGANGAVEAETGAVSASDL